MVMEEEWEQRSLPYWVYHNPEFAQLEYENIFRKEWILVGHQSEVPEVGNYMILKAFDEQAIVIRDHDGSLKAFHNVCRHRGALLLREERGECSRALACHFHGWTYNLDGSLKGIPDSKNFPGLDKSKHGLKHLDLEVWMGFVFIRFTEEGTSMAERMAHHQEELSLYQLTDMEPYARYWNDFIPCNWKLFGEIDNEAYHVQAGHPGLSRIVGNTHYDIPPDATVMRSQWSFRDRPSSLWTDRLYQKLALGATHLPESHRKAWLFFYIYPSQTIAFYPDQVEYYQCLPLGPERCVMRGRRYVLPDAGREMDVARQLNRRINRQVGREDASFMHSAWEGMRSSAYDRGVLSKAEKGIHWFYQSLLKSMPVGRCEQAPAHGTVAETNQQMLEEE